MGIERKGRKAWYYTQSALKGRQCSEGMTLSKPHGTGGFSRDEGVFYTLPQLAEIEADHVKGRNTADCGGECHGDCDKIEMTPCELTALKASHAQALEAVNEELAETVTTLNALSNGLGELLGEDLSNGCESVEDAIDAVGKHLVAARGEGAAAMRDACMKLVDHSNDVDCGVDSWQLLGITSVDTTTYTETRKAERAKVLEEVESKLEAARLASPIDVMIGIGGAVDIVRSLAQDKE